MDCGLEGLTFISPSLCKPEFAQELDLRNIIARFLRTGQLPQMRDGAGITDATKLPQSFQELQDGVVSIRQQFEQLPEEERLKYGNDIDAWLQAQEETKPEETKPVGDSAPVTFTSGESPKPSGTATA